MPGSRSKPDKKIRILSGKPCGDASALRFHPVRGMDVIALTILVSSCLAGIFIFCFAGEFRRSRSSSPERDSLLPLDDESPLSK